MADTKPNTRQAILHERAHQIASELPETGVPSILPGPPPTTLRDVVGVDANAPIDHLGNLRPQVSDPAIIAGTGAGWVRINFILGPWHSVDDTTRHQGRTWQETYRQLIDGFRAQGLRIYGLIGVEAVGDPGDRFRFAPSSAAADPWIDRYVATFVTVLEMFAADLDVVESFNEPNDWHRLPDTTWSQAWIDPAWFAIMLQQLYLAVKIDPVIAHIPLVSGPLLGLEANAGALGYLRDTYAAGMARFAWGTDGNPFPFDAVGLHLYVHEGAQTWPAQEKAVRTTYSRLLAGIKQGIWEAEKQPKAIVISEMGWPSDGGKEEQQAQSIVLGLRLLAHDPWVNLAVAFCTQDFPAKYYGFFPAGTLPGAAPKPAYYVFQTACTARLVEPAVEDMARPRPIPPGVTNQHVIGAFKTVSLAHQLGNWGLMSRAGLKLNALVARRSAPYQGPTIDDLPNLTAAQRDQVYELLARAVGGPVSLVTGHGWLLTQPDVATAALAFPATLHIPLAGLPDASARHVARTWNRYGALLVAIADALAIDVPVATAVLAMAHGSHRHTAHGRLWIRFEVPVFYAHWGRAQAETFADHFRLDAVRPWQQPHWRPAESTRWQPVHAGQAAEWAALTTALALDEAAAYAATAMGLPRIMGFNHALVGYTAAAEMFHAFAASTRAQVVASFDLLAGPDRQSRPVQALRAGDLESSAALTAGPSAAAPVALALRQKESLVSSYLHGLL